jgi:alkylation response protein AidB-like acyl-CoA dehydrogenase
MDLEWSATDLAFRDEVRGFLDQKLTPELRQAGRLMTSVYSDHEASMEWQRILHQRGWAAPAWPIEYGGCDWSLTQHYIFGRESTLAGAPVLSPMGIRMVAYAILAYGTPAQQAYFLPRILTGEVFFCQGYSEPEAGSDLASLSMSAVDDGDDLVCTGSKIWTTHATEANWMFGLVRTSRLQRKQQGITFVLIDMTSPGIQIRPLVMISGEEIQNQIFFDGVRVPKANVLGDIDDGWTVAKYLLEFERGGGAAAAILQVMAEQIATVAAAPTGARRRSRVRSEARRSADANRGARDTRVPSAGGGS